MDDVQMWCAAAQCAAGACAALGPACVRFICVVAADVVPAGRGVQHRCHGQRAAGRSCVHAALRHGGQDQPHPAHLCALSERAGPDCCTACRHARMHAVVLHMLARLPYHPLARHSIPRWSSHAAASSSAETGRSTRGSTRCMQAPCITNRPRCSRAGGGPCLRGFMKPLSWVLYSTCAVFLAGSATPQPAQARPGERLAHKTGSGCVCWWPAGWATQAGLQPRAQLHSGAAEHWPRSRPCSRSAAQPQPTCQEGAVASSLVPRECSLQRGQQLQLVARAKEVGGDARGWLAPAVLVVEDAGLSPARHAAPEAGARPAQ